MPFDRSIRRAVGLNVPRRWGLALSCLVLQACGGGAPPSFEPAAPTPPLRLTEVLPPAADVAGGGTVSLLGAGFPVNDGPVFVHFGSRVSPAQVLDPTLLTAVVPPGDALGPVDVVLAAPTGLRVAPGAFTYLPSPPPTPVLTCLPPVGAYVVGSGGTRIDLTVRHFPPLSAPAVAFGGVPALEVQVLAADRLRVEVPDGLPGGNVLTVTLGEGNASASAPFFHQGTVNPGEVLINEFLPDPGTLDANRDGTLSSGGDEFVELVNHRGVAVDLTGFTLSDATAVRHTFPNPTSVPPGGSIVVFGGGNPTYFAERHASGHAQLSATGTLGLNNSADAVILRDPAGAIVAQASYANADVAPGRSRTALVDGRVPPVPATSADYRFHDTAPGAAGPISPGLKADGTAFP